MHLTKDGLEIFKSETYPNKRAEPIIGERRWMEIIAQVRRETKRAKVDLYVSITLGDITKASGL